MLKNILNSESMELFLKLNNNFIKFMEFCLMLNNLQIIFVNNDNNHKIMVVIKTFEKLKSVLLFERILLTSMLHKHNNSETLTLLHKEIEELQSSDFNEIDISTVNTIRSELDRIASDYPKP
jgi:hypothetical protein